MLFATVVMLGVQSIFSLYEKKYVSSFYLFFATCILTYEIVEQELSNAQIETPMYVVIIFWCLILGFVFKGIEYILKNRNK